jgi:hypothetical protein
MREQFAAWTRRRGTLALCVFLSPVAILGAVLAVTMVRVCLSFTPFLWTWALPDPPPLPTIDGPEKTELLARVDGWVIAGSCAETLEVVSLPDLGHTNVRLKGRAWLQSAPDESGRFVYVTDAGPTNRFGYTQHQARVASVDGHDDRVLFERRGNALYNDPVSFVELAPRDGLLAIATTPYDAMNPYQPRTTEELELWDIDDGSHRSLGAVRAWDASWFPDETKLAVECQLSPAENAAHEPVPADVRESSRGLVFEESPPSIQVLDIATGAWTWIAWGFEPRVSPDGEKLLYRVGRTSWTVRDLRTGASRAIALPGAFNHPCTWMSDDVVLYLALATTGSDPGVLRTPMKLPQPMWTMKAARIDTQEFKTVCPSVGRFSRFSFGRRG